MDINTKLIIKVQLNDEIRKMPIHNEDITYDELIIMMERVFKHKLNADDEIIIKYKDEDGDLITISDDSDLGFAIESSKILKLSLTVENNLNDEIKNDLELNSIQISAIKKELQVIRDHANRVLDRLSNVYGKEALNTITSGRNSPTECKYLQEVNGKEFDPLSVGNHPQLNTVERTETSNSYISNNRNDETTINSDAGRSYNHETQSDHNQMQRPSSVDASKLQNSAGSPAMSGMIGQSQMQPIQSTMSYGMSSQETAPNMNTYVKPAMAAGPFMPPVNMGIPSSGMPPTMPTGHNMPPPSVGMGAQNPQGQLAHSNIANMPGPGQPGLGGMRASPQAMPPYLNQPGAPKPPLDQSAQMHQAGPPNPGAASAFVGQTANPQMANQNRGQPPQRPMYPGGTMPPPRMAASNFQGPMVPGNQQQQQQPQVFGGQPGVRPQFAPPPHMPPHLQQQQQQQQQYHGYTYPPVQN